ncbi:hypothetical protein [Paraburkholderia domus]|uniref:hypothetical protein n=1 Tax=Paraburkholderia domus TaxID=2793075 RepID=UPI001B0F7589|nr:hypothetical protein [Paraburkholderia domus]CAE6835130.1 hypothetical protein R75483_06882 [Paraburkholderia domus]
MNECELELANAKRAASEGKASELERELVAALAQFAANPGCTSMQLSDGRWIHSTGQISRCRDAAADAYL